MPPMPSTPPTTSATWPGRAWRRRQDDPGGGVARARRCSRCARKRDEGHVRMRLRTAGEGAPALAPHCDRELRLRLPAREPRRYARVPRPSRPGAAGSCRGGNRGRRGDARQGVQMVTRRMMETAAERGLARMIVVNKIDAEELDLEALLGSLVELLRHRVHAHQPAGRRWRESGGLLLRDRGRTGGLLLDRGGPYQNRRSGRRGGRGS